MAYEFERGMPINYEGRDHYCAQARLRRKLRKTDSINLEDLDHAFHCLPDKNKALEADYRIKDKLNEVLKKIRNGTYGPSKVKTKKIPKSSGGLRTLDIPDILDRAVAKAVLEKISAVVDAKFDSRSHGGRPEKSIQSAIAAAHKALEEGMNYAIEADIKDAFPNTPTEGAIAILERLSGRHKCMESAKVCIRGHKGAVRKTGLKQGCPLSPISFNAYMHEWTDSLVPIDADICYVRYLDNLYLFGKDPNKLANIMAIINGSLTGKGFVLKTSPCLDLKSEKLSILGFQVGLDGSKIEILGDKDSFKDLAFSLERAYDEPNSHKLGKPKVDSWLSSQALRTSWDLKDTHLVNELLEYHGFQYRLNHEDVIKDLQDQRSSWSKKYNLNSHTP